MKQKKRVKNTKITVATVTAKPKQITQGHALDGSQQLTIVEEQLYTIADGAAKDQPLVPAKSDNDVHLQDSPHDISIG